MDCAELLEAFPFGTAPKYLLRDRDGIHRQEFRKQIEVMNTNESAQRSAISVARAYVERVIGSVRREYLDHVLIFDEDSLRRTLRSYFSYHRWRLHLSLGKGSPDSRLVQSIGRITAFPEVGGLIDASASPDHLISYFSRCWPKPKAVRVDADRTTNV